jgi:hypothetical protein
MAITFLAAVAMLTLWMSGQPAKTHGDVLASTMTLQVSPCFNVDPGIGNPNRDDHFRWAQQQDSTKLANNLAWKIGIIFNCSSMSGDQLVRGFGAMSGIIADYVSNPACFNNDVSVTGRDRSAHERWARTKSREQVRDNLQWKAVAAMKCLNRDYQVAFFADESAAVAKIPSGGGGDGGAGCRSEYTMNAPSSAGVYQKINISFSAPADHNPKGWIGIYAAGATPGKEGYASWEYVSAERQCSGAVTLPGVPAGQYVVYYFLDSGYDKIASRSNLSVR